MYERFTDRSRKVMQLANQEAQRFNHEYIGTEHILSGLVKEGAGVAANVLKDQRVLLNDVRLEIDKIVLPGPNKVTLGRLPQTPKAKKVIEYAIEEARNLDHKYVGTEHLLLGLVRDTENVACQILLNLGLKPEDVKKRVIAVLAGGSRGGVCLLHCVCWLAWAANRHRELWVLVWALAGSIGGALLGDAMAELEGGVIGSVAGTAFLGALAYLVLPAKRKNAPL